MNTCMHTRNLTQISGNGAPHPEDFDLRPNLEFTKEGRERERQVRMEVEGPSVSGPPSELVLGLLRSGEAVLRVVHKEDGLRPYHTRLAFRKLLAEEIVEIGAFRAGRVQPGKCGD